MPSQELKKAIMNRVLIVYIARRILHPRSLTAGWLVILLAGLFWFVSVLDVIKNFYSATRGFSDAYGFLSRAFFHTSLGVQAIFLGLVAVGVVFAVDIYRTFLFSRGGTDSQLIRPNNFHV